MRSMKRLLTVTMAAMLTFSGSTRAEGPDDAYIEIYKIIQEGDQLAATGRSDFARDRYATAQAELKKLQKSYPTWNTKLVEFRLRNLEGKLAVTPQPPAAAIAPAQAPAEKAASTPPAQAQPAPTPAQPAPAEAKPIQPALEAAPAAPVAPKQAEADERDAQIRTLQEQVGRLQSDKSVLEAKLREALTAQPAAVDPRELARAEDRIRALEKEKEVLAVSVQVAEARASQRTDAEAAELKKALAEAKQKVEEQNDAIIALRQEKEILQQRLQAAPRPDDDTIKTLRSENETLRKQLAEKSAAVPTAPAPDASALDKELSSTRAALQSSRETLASLQVRVRTLQDERDRLDKTRKELETKLASSSGASADVGEAKRLQKERDDLQKRLNEANRQLADSRKSASQKGRSPGDEASSLRARLDVLEARKVPYTPEELALFKKPEEPAVLAAAPVETPATPAAPAEPPPGAATLMADAQRAFAARRFDEAEKKYLEVLRLDEKNVGTLQRLGAAQLEQNRPKDAEATLQKALEQSPKDARTLLLMGIAKFDQDKFDEAFDNLSRSAQLDPQNAETQNYLGIT